MKLTLGNKLGLGFGLILGLLVFSSAMTYLKSMKTSQSEASAFEVRFPSLKTAIKLQRDLNYTQVKGRQAILAGSQQGRREEAKKAFDGAWRSVGEDVAELDKLAPRWTLQEDRERLNGVKEQLPALRTVQESVIILAASGGKDAVVNAGNESADRATPINIAMKKTLGAMAESLEKLADENRDELKSENRSLNVAMLVTTVAALSLGILVAIFLSRGISSSARVLLGQAEAIAGGDLTREDLKVRSRDELGDLTVSINKMSNSLKTMISTIAEDAAEVSEASQKLSATSREITSNSEQTSARANVVSGAAERVSQNLQTVATGAEEMAASIKEIAKNATEAAKVATAAVKVAESTTVTVTKLGHSSGEIGQVIKVITSIAQQTNLLALNATIEAARAGEAGKGFAVVANEVKELAKETAKATEEIGRKIAAIQTDTTAAVEAIVSISGVINQINDISSSIATAVEEQNATTNEMSRNVSEAAHGGGEITSNISGVAAAAQDTTRGATNTQEAAEKLVATSAQLRRVVEQFTLTAGANNEVRADVRSKAASAGFD